MLNHRDFKYESRVHFVKFLGSLDYTVSTISEHEWQRMYKKAAG
jgi:hypothetical protein